ncbi:MAG: hypothetical protein H6713_01765 [Myxococcales bacterium]|nr:hypothetical protein [Myxococcales bacterium]
MWIVPRPRGARAVALRLTVTNAPPPPAAHVLLRSAQGARELDFAVTWERVGDGPLAAWWTSLLVEDLEPDERYQIWAELGGRRVGPAMARTLPDELPSDPSRPLSLLLGSCFSYRSDKQGAVGDLPGILPFARAPHVKLLCGDQVYLDYPVGQPQPNKDDALRELFLRKYQETWDQGAGPGDRGFGSFLRWGSTVFVSDDHEFWNEYPMKQLQLSGTWSRDGRERRRRISRELFRAFQEAYGRGDGTRTLRTIEVGEPGTSGHLEIKVLDGRYFRTRARAFWPADLEAVRDWLGALSRPGVLVLNQPIFARAKPGVLPQFEDYGALCGALQRARHDVLVLAGDIHGGRLARVELTRSHGAPAPTTIHELIASPMALTRPSAYAKAPAHGTFPAGKVVTGWRGQRAAVTTQAIVAEDHVASLELLRKGDAVHVTIDFWRPRGLPVKNGARRPPGPILRQSARLVLR